MGWGADAFTQLILSDITTKMGPALIHAWPTVSDRPGIDGNRGAGRGFQGGPHVYILPPLSTFHSSIHCKYTHLHCVYTPRISTMMLRGPATWVCLALGMACRFSPHPRNRCKSSHISPMWSHLSSCAPPYMAVSCACP